ncbi:MAG: ferritin [Saprospiraceae bacterium]|nr:ferritin [Saprospiraceae bacterium]
MLNEKVYKALNQQIEVEADSSAIYLAMASWCDKEGLAGCAQFFYAQSDEERMHMLKLVHYINEMDAHAIVPGLTAPKIDYPSIQDVFQIVYKQEKLVTESIHKIMDICNECNDHATIHFLQWYVAEQREEEAQVREILDKIRLIGSGGQSLYYIDKEIEKINKKRIAAEAEEEAAA